MLPALLAGGCTDGADRLVLATTSSAYDSGLLTALAEAWRLGEAPPDVHILVTGSGEALALGRRGDADMLLVHAPVAEAAFMDAGHGVLRLEVMRSDFLIVGPAADPAGVGAAPDPPDAFRRIDAAGTFLSRGDNSGTHDRELQIRAAAGLPPGGTDPRRYIDAGQGMGETLRMAAERGAYTLTDRATWETWRLGLDLVAFPQRHALLHNPYSVIVPARSGNADAANRFARWLTAPHAQALIAEFRGAAAKPPFSPAGAEPALPATAPAGAAGGR